MLTMPSNERLGLQHLLYTPEYVEKVSPKGQIKFAFTYHHVYKWLMLSTQDSLVSSREVSDIAQEIAVINLKSIFTH